MLAKVAQELPTGEGFLFEPKWDGIRALVFRDASGVTLQGRDGKALNRQFPELEKVLVEQLPRGCVLDGEIVVAAAGGLDFDALQQRLHPAPSRIARLAKETPAAFVAFDLLAAGGASTMALAQSERRLRLERLLGQARAPLHLTPATSDRAQAQDWLQRFAGAGLDGVIAKPGAATYQPGKRTLFKIKHERTADCVVAGFRWHKEFTEGVVGSLLLGLYDDAGVLQNAGVTSAFSMETRRQLALELEPLRANALQDHPWKDATQGWEPLRPERVVEVQYEHLQGERFRDATVFVRWREDKAPRDCGYGQLEVATPTELAQVLAGGRKSGPRP